MRRHALCAIILACATITASGCGSSSIVSVSGTLTKGGSAIQLGEDDWVQMMLVPTDSATTGEWFPANVEKDGRFSVPGKEGYGIPPGKYRVAVSWVTHKDRSNDRLHGVFGRNTSPIVKEISGSARLEIDLDTSAPPPTDPAGAEAGTAKKSRKRQDAPSD